MICGVPYICSLLHVCRLRWHVSAGSRALCLTPRWRACAPSQGVRTGSLNGSGDKKDGAVPDAILIEKPALRKSEDADKPSAANVAAASLSEDTVAIAAGPTHKSFLSQDAAKRCESSGDDEVCAIARAGQEEAPSKDFYELSSVYISNIDPNQPVKARSHLTSARLAAGLHALRQQHVKPDQTALVLLRTAIQTGP
jgi:hypothetical protein